MDQLIAKVHQLDPALSDIELWPSGQSPGAQAAVVYAQAGGGFELVFRRGSGDCPAGCIDNEYWYFETDAACAPNQVGHYARSFDESGNCYDETGTPMWGEPSALDPAAACRARP